MGGGGRGRVMVIAAWLKQPRHVQAHNKRPEEHVNTAQNMLYVPWMVILCGHNIIKTSFENFDF